LFYTNRIFTVLKRLYPSLYNKIKLFKGLKKEFRDNRYVYRYGNVTWDNNGLFLTENTYDKVKHRKLKTLMLNSFQNKFKYSIQFIKINNKYFNIQYFIFN